MIFQKSAPAGAIAVSDLESAVLHKQESGTHQPAEHAHRDRFSTQPVTSKAGIDPLYAPLSLENYEEKFEKLVQAERETHEGILRSRYVYQCTVL